MTFDFVGIAVSSALALFSALFIRGRGRQWLLFVSSVLAIYWLQSFTPVRFADFILQTTTIVLTVLTWWVTRPLEDQETPSDSAGSHRQNWLSLFILFSLILVVSLNRFVDSSWRLTPSRPPSPVWVAAVFISLTLLFMAAWRWLRRLPQRTLTTAVILLIVILFVLLKAPVLTTAVAALWRSVTGQQITLASPSDLVWVGFSYVAFRLIHTLRDRQTGQLPRLQLHEFVTYVLFFPSYISGPIDRVERFTADFRQLPQLPARTTGRWLQGGRRIVSGLFKKFVIADSLALGLSLTAVNAQQTNAAGWLWLLLYGYALRLFFDFSGYTDIAIGIGLLFGITLPENFKRPYRQTNITAFWQSWHITLSNWARFYIFLPLSRSLLRRKPRPSPTLIILTAHLTTMTVIGLWHGITLNFFIWGLWHGFALFIHKQWSDRTRQWYRGLNDKPWQKRIWSFCGWFLTFHYVALGWAWFLMPTPQLAWQTLGHLFGLGT